jgi:hypothetical protein
LQALKPLPFCTSHDRIYSGALGRFHHIHVHIHKFPFENPRASGLRSLLNSGEINRGFLPVISKYKRRKQKTPPVRVAGSIKYIPGEG